MLQLYRFALLTVFGWNSYGFMAIPIIFLALSLYLFFREWALRLHKNSVIPQRKPTCGVLSVVEGLVNLELASV